jgi:hypothetical protein
MKAGGAMAKYSSTDKESPGFVSKKCHECYEYVPLDAEICPSCKVRLGKVGRHGMARKVTDWKAYLAFLVAFAAFLIFCLYAFF